MSTSNIENNTNNPPTGTTMPTGPTPNTTKSPPKSNLTLTLPPPPPLNRITSDITHTKKSCITRSCSRRRNGRRDSESSSSRVPIDHFDPEGMGELRRTLTDFENEGGRVGGRLGAPLFGVGVMQERNGNTMNANANADADAIDNIEEKRQSTAVVSMSISENSRSGSGPGSAREEEDDVTLAEALNNFDEGNFDFEKLLKAAVRKGDATHIPRRTLGVVFQNLHVTGLGSDASYQSTFGSMLNPKEWWNILQRWRHPPVKDILRGVEGVVRPGEMLFVLGRPGSGCTSLLKSLTLHTSAYHSITSQPTHSNPTINQPPYPILYPPFTPSEIKSHYRGDVIYTPEDDTHFPTLTVGETIRFAVSTRAPQATARISMRGDADDSATRDEWIDTVTSVLLTIFGLKHAKDTVVGDASIRGVSGGEKKRVSIAEALAARALLGGWDNSTRGLDASTALEFARALRIATDICSLSTIVSIYQASENLYNLFDKVCVLSEGQMVFFGEAREARNYFIDMGWEAEERMTTADFLVSVTDPNARTPREGYESRVPRTTDEFVKCFQESEYGRRNKENIKAYLEEYDMGEYVLPSSIVSKPSSVTSSTSNSITAEKEKNQNANENSKAMVPSSPKSPKAPRPSSGTVAHADMYKHSARIEKAKHARKGGSFTISIWMQARLVMKRRVLILKGDWGAVVAQLLAYVFQAIIISTVFINIPDATSAYFSRGGVLFFSILFGALSAMAEIPSLYSQRPIVYRHHKAAMYHPFIDSLALTLVDVPITLVTQLIFSVLIYFVVGLQRTAGQFFVFYLFIITMVLTMKAFFRMLAAAFKREAGAQSVAGLAVLLLSLYTGYTIPKPSIIGALRWITYINPIRYGFEAVLTNEFHTLNGACSSLVPSGPGYEGVSLMNQVCTTVGSVSGQNTVNGNTFVGISYEYSYSHLWRNFGISIIFGAAFLIAYLFLTERSTASAFDASITLYKRGSKAAPILSSNNSVADEEKGASTRDPSISNGSSVADERGEKSKEEVEQALKSAPTMTDVFSWQHINYIIPVSGGEKRTLLSDVSGFVAPGKLTALMGESGAGKTTLLNVLAERYSVGVVTGDRFVNGQALPSDFQAQTGYCQQTDTHLPEATVREALLFSAKLRQPQSVPLAEKEAYVEMCLKMCGLEDYGDAIVGSLGVEHKKRTTIGVELAAKPRLLLFLDEPTSGLDSQSAWAIMAFLRSLANNGQAILCTIHQPSAELFQVFDRLLLLRKGGETVYFGDLGKNSSSIISYFEKNGAASCAPDANPAEWMLDVIGAGATASSDIDWHDIWKKSTESENLQNELDRINEEGRKKPPVTATMRTTFSASWPYQLYVLMERGFSSYWRNTTYLAAKMTLNLFAGLFIGFTFFKSKDTLQGNQNKLFAVFMATILSVPLSNQLQTVFINFRNVYEIRERSSRTYSWTALVASQFLVELPWNILGSSIFFFCWYWTVGFESSRAGYSYLAFGVILPFYYTSIAQAVAAMAPNAVIAGILFSTLFTFVITFNGVLQPFRLLGWWRWMYRVSPFTYFIEGTLGQAIGQQNISCAPAEFVIVIPPNGSTCINYMQQYISLAGGYLTNPDATSDCQFCQYRTTDQFLNDSFNIEYSHRWRDIGIVIGVTIFNIGAIFALTYLFRIRTGKTIANIRDKVATFRKSKKE